MKPRPLRAVLVVIVMLAGLSTLCYGQISNFPYVQNFDSVTTPALPPGWSSTQNRTPATNDFTTSATNPHSVPHSVGSTNGRVPQSLTSALFDFSAAVPESLMFWVVRSSTYSARMIVEASLDSGVTFPIQLGDSLRNTSTAYVKTSLRLPSSLASGAVVVFRWRIIGDPSSGTSGTLRIDDITVTALRNADLSLSAVRLRPLFPIEGDSVFAIAKIINLGQQSAQIFSAEFFVDVNNDSIPQPLELRATTQSASLLSPSDSVELTANLGSFTAGSKVVIAKILYVPDQNLSNNQRGITLNVGFRRRSIVINEIMYAPIGTEPEWVELLNTRLDSINLKGWTVSDNAVTSKHVITARDVFIPANGYVILTRDSAALVDIHPSIRAKVLNVSGFPSLNNSGDAVVVYDNRSATMDSVSYVPGWGGNSGGTSIERIDPVASSTLQSNWGTSRNAERSTPGGQNSLSRKNRDLALDSLHVFPLLPLVGDSIRIDVPTKNPGRETVSSFIVRLFRDANADSLPQPSEEIGNIAYSLPLQPLDSTTLSFNIGSSESHLSIATIEFATDEDTTNNIMVRSVTVGYLPGSVRVNEIMYAPTGTEPEWIELVNTRPDSLNLKNWLVSDNLTTTKRVLTTQNIFIPPQGYVVVTKDSAALRDVHSSLRVKVLQVTTFPSLNNSGDAVVLYDNRSAIMDSVSYLPGWGGNSGNSLERIDIFGSSIQRDNWGASRNLEHSTPGERNSLARKDRDLAIDSVRVSPELPLAGDSVLFIVPIKNPGREAIASFAVQLFRDTNADTLPQPNELLGSFAHATPLLPLDSTVVVITREIDAGTHMFIARIEFHADEDTANNISPVRVTVGYPSGSVRINEIMYAPKPGEPEWIELFNSRSDTVDLGEWFVGNRSSSRYKISATRLLLPPNDFVAVAKDSALLQAAYPGFNGRIVQAAALPTFLWSNNGDAVVLADNRKAVVDSVFYLPSWGGNDGKSLERIDPLAGANDSANWAASLDSLGATLSRKNSQVLLDNDLRLMRITTDTIAFGSNAALRAVVRNVGRLASSQFDVKVFDDIDRDSLGTATEQVVRTTISQVLAARESTVVHLNWLKPASGIHSVIVEIDYPADERLTNNIAFSTMRAGFPERTMVINEIMYAPLTANAEYVELYNASEADVDIAQWKIHDRTNAGSANEFTLSDTSAILHPGELFVLASDSSVLRMLASVDNRLITIANQSSLSLNNDGDDIVLLDPSGVVIDSMSYAPSWHNPNVKDQTGRALEKINPALATRDKRNWSTCTQSGGGTPGKQNSVYAIALPSGSKLSVSPNPFSPDGDGREDFALIQFEVPVAVSTIRARIYDAAGRHIRTLANSEASGSRGNIVWDGMNDERQKARVGIYIVLLEAIDDRGGVIETAKGVVVLAAKM